MRLFEKKREEKVARVPMAHRVRSDVRKYAKGRSELVEGALDALRLVEEENGERLRERADALQLSVPETLALMVAQGLNASVARGRKGKR